MAAAGGQPTLKAWNETRQTSLVEHGRIAQSWRARLQGLLGTTELAPGDGLLLEPCSSIHSFGMRYAFDALFLDSQGRVVNSVERMPPNRIGRPVLAARCVLELPAGTIQAMGTQPGDLIRIRSDAGSPRWAGTQEPGAGPDLPRGLIARWSRFTPDHILPSALFGYLFLTEIMHSRDIWAWEGVAAGLDAPGRAWLLVQRVLTTAFVALVAALFALRRARRSPRAGPLPALVALAATTLWALGLLAPPTERSPALTVPGSVLVTAGSAWMVLSLAYLGRSFGVFPEARRLVTGGPYRYVRHPLYLGEIVATLGGILPALSAYTAIVFLAFVGLQYWRALYEEHVLVAVFPEYAGYAQRTWRILPGIH